MKRILLFLLFSVFAYGQTTGSSISFSTAAGNTCEAPTAGKTIVCGTPTAVTVSFNGSAAVTLPAQGTPGAAATVTIGTVTAGAAGSTPKVTNSGTSSAAVLNFTIPVGATGPQGQIGATGPAGVQGSQGVAGPPGAKGDTGATGPQGPPGTATLVNANCSLKFTGAATTDGGVAVTITCQ